MVRDSITRRRVLGAVGSVGFLAVSARVGRAAFGLDRVDMTNQYQIQQADSLPPVQLRWRETYNGQVLETQTQPTDNPAGPVISLDGVLPGDQGSLTLQVELGSTDSSSDSARIRMYADIYENRDNGINEPEWEANDQGPPGDLSPNLAVDLRYDGGCNAVDIPLLPDDPDIASGTIEDVATQLSKGTGGVLLQHSSTTTCFSTGDATCITLVWDFPPDLGNKIQGDSLGFRLLFVPEECPGGG